jgi:hypothetical protein
MSFKEEREKETLFLLCLLGLSGVMVIRGTTSSGKGDGLGDAAGVLWALFAEVGTPPGVRIGSGGGRG